MYAFRVINRLSTKSEDFLLKFGQIHTAVTNHLIHSGQETVELLKKQEARWDAYLVAQAASKAHHGD